jgi:hypothetical protein
VTDHGHVRVKNPPPLAKARTQLRRLNLHILCTDNLVRSADKSVVTDDNMGTE